VRTGRTEADNFYIFGLIKPGELEMSSHRYFYIACIFLVLCIGPDRLIAQDIGDPDCNRLLLISAYAGQNVKIYNACDGSFIRNLDSNGYLQGPQAIAIDPQGDLIVVSENNGRLVKYHRESLTYDRVIAGDRPETTQIEPAPVNDPTGLVITPGGRILLGSYSGHTVTEIDPASGDAMEHLVTFTGSGIRGPDTGMALDNNRLLVPGFDSSSIVQVDITNPGSDSELVGTGAGGLNAPRTVLKTTGGTLLVTSWRGNAILEYDAATGNFVRVVSTGVKRPTGMAFESETTLLVASDMNNDVHRVRISDGVVLEKFIDFTEGLLSGPTFILVLDKQVSKLSENRAFWIIGVGQIEGKSIHVEEMFFTSGGAFGQAFNPDAISNVPWGGLDIDFWTCDSGQIFWNPLEAQFDDGMYDVFRLAADPFGDACNEAGFDFVENSHWMSGLWYGGPARNGEGLSINVINGNQAVVTWYTYLPVDNN
jgi:hypothetical protein